MTKEDRQGALLVSAMFAVALAFLTVCFCVYGVFLAIEKNQPRNANLEKKTMIFNKEKISGILAVVSALGALAASVAMILEMVNPKWGAAALVISNALALFTKRIQSVLKPKRKTKQIISCLLIATFGMSMLTACPAKNIETAKAQSAKLARYSNAGINLTRELYRGNMITLDQKDKIADGFLNLAKAGQMFDAAVAQIERTYGSNIPRSELEKLFESFNGIIIGKFLDLMKDLKIFTADGRVREIIEAIRTAILIAAKAFGKGYEIRQKIEAI